MTFSLLAHLHLSSPQLPSDVMEWSDWVAEQHPESRCIDRKQNNCSWLSELALELQDDEGRFRLQGEQFAPGWIPLLETKILFR